jgi:hypothetical protein
VGSIPLVMQFVKRATEKSLAQAVCGCRRFERGRDGRKAGGLCKVCRNESCPGGSGQLARSTWLSWGVLTWQHVGPELPTPVTGLKNRQ